MNIFKKLINKPSRIGSSPIDPSMLNSSTITTSTNGMYIVPGAGYVPTIPPTGPIGTTNSTGTTLGQDYWTKEEKAALAKVGFQYDKKKECWNISLSTTVSILQLKNIMSWPIEKSKPSDIAIDTMKQLKKQLIEKLTAKIILMELIKPHEIKE